MKSWRVRIMKMVRISSKGQMVIPKAIRDRLGIRPNKPVILEVAKDHVVIRPLPDVKKTLKGILKGKPSMKKALLQDHLSEVQQDEKLSL
jgi:AbrB family looped-hinge helix DNA binding protein